MNILELFAAAQNLEVSGNKQGAVALYQQWAATHPDDPALHACYFNLGTLLLHQGDNHAALTAFNESVRLRPDFMPSVISLGSALERLGQMELAIEYWRQAVNQLSPVSSDTIGYKTTALKQLARVLTQRQQAAEAEEMLRLSLDVAPHNREELQHWANARQRLCKWPVPQSVGPIKVADVVATMAPLTLAYYTDDPMLALANAYNYCRRDLVWPRKFKTSADFAGRRRRDDGRLRIGYVSSDLRAHAIGYLTSELFSLHDRSRVEVFAFFCGFQLEDPTMMRIRASVDHWIDINGLEDAKTAELIEELGIDILVDINGHTKDARTRMLALRPAPVIINWLGFPGTMGSPYHHYIIADEVIIPPGSEKYFSEQVLRLPCYQPNDRKRVTSPVVPSRTDCGLPENATVFCCFNGMQKLTRFTLQRWAEILRRVENSVLWILAAGKESDARFLELMAANGIDASRIVFAPYAANPDHMARYALADLFLDNAPYGGHTTGSDALWAGVPVLTVPGRAFHSRVCASLVMAAGIPELVCLDPREYVEKAVRLGNDRPALRALKQKLLELRDHSVLFDTELFARSMEDLFDQVWSEWEAGQLPVPDLTNLDTYLEIGSAFDHDVEEFGFISDYEERYRQELALRHALTPIPHDQRLWPLPD
ncbi:tetratricopeptide repeat protein [Niveispirillum sp.]|uniref:O-linked N-acetylglucosamine transferase, SPINDLY family protein n=1 Tax=Niveispirillum sp. TaxID=1917217 RepID=UPI001B79E15D|nr:tetratricopeptide repeat protein [Niveispirillum sp.]MBP7334807.1 tetratricopeptide repeat protein [Niveispirillum sp.]